LAFPGAFGCGVRWAEAESAAITPATNPTMNPVRINRMSQTMCRWPSARKCNFHPRLR
jgi:hypothetical protein